MSDGRRRKVAMHLSYPQKSPDMYTYPQTLDTVWLSSSGHARDQASKRHKGSNIVCRKRQLSSSPSSRKPQHRVEDGTKDLQLVGETSHSVRELRRSLKVTEDKNSQLSRQLAFVSTELRRRDIEVAAQAEQQSYLFQKLNAVFSEEDQGEVVGEVDLIEKAQRALQDKEEIIHKLRMEVPRLEKRSASTHTTPDSGTIDTATQTIRCVGLVEEVGKEREIQDVQLDVDTSELGALRRDIGDVKQQMGRLVEEMGKYFETQSGPPAEQKEAGSVSTALGSGAAPVKVEEGAALPPIQDAVRRFVQAVEREWAELSSTIGGGGLVSPSLHLEDSITTTPTVHYIGEPSHTTSAVAPASPAIPEGASAGGRGEERAGVGGGGAGGGGGGKSSSSSSSSSTTTTTANYRAAMMKLRHMERAQARERRGWEREREAWARDREGIRHLKASWAEERRRARKHEEESEGRWAEERKAWCERVMALERELAVVATGVAAPARVSSQ